MTAEQFIKDYTNHCSNELAYGGFHEWLTPEQALRAVEIANDAFIEKACQWLERNFNMPNDFEYHFRKAMKGEQIMNDDSIINAAKEFENSTVFDDIVLKAKCVNSAAGIGFLEGAVWARKRIRGEIERLHEEYRGKKGDADVRRALRTVLFFIDSM